MNDSIDRTGRRGRAGASFVETPAFEWLSRAGFVARGAVYAIIGILAFKLAVGHGGKLTNQQGAMRTLAHQPFGKYLLTLLAIGLAGYSMWRLFRAALGRGPEGADKGFDRLAALGSGLAYGAAVRARGRDPPRSRLLGQRVAEEVGGGCPRLARGRLDRRDRRRRAGRDRSLPGVPWRLAVVPRRLEGRGDVARRQGVDRPARDGRAPRADGRLRPRRDLPDQGRRRVQPEQGGRRSTVRWPSSRTPRYGPYLLGLVAAGLIAFAVYSFSDARYRRI